MDGTLVRQDEDGLGGVLGQALYVGQDVLHYVRTDV